MLNVFIEKRRAPLRVRQQVVKWYWNGQNPGLLAIVLFEEGWGLNPMIVTLLCRAQQAGRSLMKIHPYTCICIIPIAVLCLNMLPCIYATLLSFYPSWLSHEIEKGYNRSTHPPLPSLILGLIAFKPQYISIKNYVLNRASLK